MHELQTAGAFVDTHIWIGAKGRNTAQALDTGARNPDLQANTTISQDVQSGARARNCYVGHGHANY